MAVGFCSVVRCRRSSIQFDVIRRYDSCMFVLPPDAVPGYRHLLPLPSPTTVIHRSSPATTASTRIMTPPCRLLLPPLRRLGGPPADTATCHRSVLFPFAFGRARFEPYASVRMDG